MDRKYIIAILVIIIVILAAALVVVFNNNNSVQNNTNNNSSDLSSSLTFDNLKIPGDFSLIESDDDDAKYQSKQDSNTIFFKIERCSSLADAKEEMDDIVGSNGNIYNYIDDDRDDLGCKEIVQFDGKYYYICVSVNNAPNIDSQAIFNSLKTILDTFNQANGLTPLSV